MVPGAKSPFYEFITNIFPLLKLSRFPSSDYRIFIAIPIIIFGILSLKSIIENKSSWKFILIRTILVCIWFVIGISMVYSNIIDSQFMIAIFIMFFTILSIIYYSTIIRHKENISNFLRKKKTLIPITVFVILISINGFTVITDIPTWNVPSTSKVYGELYVDLIEDGRLVTYKIFENLPSERPEREDTAHKSLFSWKGYLTGKYMMKDSVSGAVSHPRKTVEENEIYKQFMLMEWSPILLDPNLVKIDNKKISLSDELFSNIKSSDKDFIKQTHYGIDDISYTISLNEPKLLVENEMYFPGWKATLIYPNKEIEIDAVETNGVFRSWLLPSGNYEMKAFFQFPNMILFKLISIVASLIWISTVIIFWKKKEKSTNII